ncbi:MAG: hypothetical protein KIS78_26190 [Labilithrix sp.]|nr:hypothetical protein [Labilithrix sp.]
MAGAAVAACSGPPPGGSSDAPTSSATFSLSGASFAGNSIRICGAREKPVDEKYRCRSSLDGLFSPGGKPTTACPCFDFDDDGRLIHPVTGDELVVDGLCPSDSAPAADWTFGYRIFAKQGCQGAQLNDGSHNFTCYDADDLARREHPNKSVEPLYRGRNENHVVCVTKNASKAWRFESCADTTSPDDVSRRQSRYDCGCELKERKPSKYGLPRCECPGGLQEVPKGCTFSLPTCDIVCSSEPRTPGK